MSNKGQIGTAGLCYLGKSLGIDFRIGTRKDKPDIYSLRRGRTKRYNKEKNLINNIDLYEYNGEYVYDLETEDGTFQAGVGEITG